MADKPMKMNPAVHFEMLAEDRKRMADFNAVMVIAALQTYQLHRRTLSDFLMAEF